MDVEKELTMNEEEQIPDTDFNADESSRDPADRWNTEPKEAEPLRPWWQRALLKFGHDFLGLPVRVQDTVALILMVVVADIGLYSEPGGTGAGFVLIGATVGLMALRWQRARAAIAPALITIAIALMGMWRHWWLLPVVGWGALVLTAIKLHCPEWRILEALWAGFSSLFRAPARLLGHVLGIYIRASDDEGRGEVTRRGIPLRAVLIPIATCIVFVLIFRAANPVVSRITEKLSDHIVEWCERFTELIALGRMMMWGLWLLLFAALMRPIGKSLGVKLLAVLDMMTQPKESGTHDDGNYITALLTLLCVNILFLAYHAMDAVYLYFKATLPEGITWTDYTHAGCGWLTLGLAVSTGVIGIVFSGGLNFHPHVRRLRVLVDIWAIQNLVLAVGAIRRLMMYIDYSGLTHLRITGIYGSILVAVGLVIMVVKVHRQHGFVWILHKDILALSVALAVLSLTPNDVICARYNVAKVIEGKPRALRPICLKILTPEALPPLIQLLDYERGDGDLAKQKIIRNGIAAILATHLETLDEMEDVPWTRRQKCASWARGELEGVRGRILEMAPPAQREAARRLLLHNMDA